VREGMAMLRGPMQSVISGINSFFNKYVINLGNQVFVWVFEKGVNVAASFLVGEERWRNMKQKLRAGVNMMVSTGNKIMNVAFQKVNSMRPGPGRVKATQALQNMLAGKLKLAELTPLVFTVIQQALIDVLVDQLNSILPHVYDIVLDIGNCIVVPAASLGANVGVATGSCASEWISTGIANVVQQVWTWAQTGGRQAFYDATRKLVTWVLNSVFSLINKKLIQPLVQKVMKPIDEKVGGFFKKILDQIKKILNMLPPGVRRVIQKVVKDFLAKLLTTVMGTASENNRLNDALRSAMQSSA